MKSFTLILSILVVATLATKLHGAPAEPPLLPGGVVYSLAGEPLATEGIGKERAVLLLLLKNMSTGGEQILNFVETMKKPLPAGKLLVIVEGVDERLLKEMAARHTNLPASWYRDSDGLLAKGLALKASPAIMGVREGSVAWITFGLVDRALLESRMHGWIKR